MRAAKAALFFYNKNMSMVIRVLLVLAGTVSLTLGVIGIFLPLLPTTPFLLLSAACYARSSDRLYSWLLDHSVFGNYIKDWREGKGVPLRVKVLSIALLVLTIGYSAFFVIDNMAIKGLLIAIGAAVALHINSFPVKRP